MKPNGKGCRSKLQCATLVETALLLCAEPNTIIAPNVGALVYLYWYDQVRWIRFDSRLDFATNVAQNRSTNEKSDVWNGPDYFEIYTVVEDNKNILYRYHQH